MARALSRILVALLALTVLACGKQSRLSPSRNATGEPIRGTVIAIQDGDTVTVLDASRVEQRIRISGIDSPERGQPYSRSAKAALSSIAFGKVAKIYWTRRDRYGRVVGKVMLPDPDCRTRDCPPTFDAGLAQVTSGMAWWYRRYADEQPPADRRAYETAERDARARRIGLWSDQDPTPPWEWRAEKTPR